MTNASDLYRNLILSIAIGLFLASCSGSQTMNTPTILTTRIPSSLTPFSILTPSATLINPPKPTPLPTSTRTPSPTSTITSSPTPIINQTTSGVVTRDEIWRGEILVTGDITIPEGVTLIIEPGTIVSFTAQNDDLRKGGEEDLAIPERIYFPDDPPAVPANMIVVFVDGKLVAQGTESNPILFTSNSDRPSVNDWQGFEAVGEAIIEHSIVEYAYWAIQVSSSTVLKMQNTTFQHIATCAVCPGRNHISRQLIIAGNTFINCGHEGIDSHEGQNIIVRGNRFIGNVVGTIANDGSTILIEKNFYQGNRTGISINNRGNPTIIGNEITESTLFGIWLWEESSANISNNNIYANAVNLGLGRTSNDIKAENNWWGTSDPSKIRYFIHDGRDEGSGPGIVDYEPYYSELVNLDVVDE